mgnify:CR=1 FL=1
MMSKLFFYERTRHPNWNRRFNQLVRFNLQTNTKNEKHQIDKQKHFTHGSTPFIEIRNHLNNFVKMVCTFIHDGD